MLTYIQNSDRKNAVDDATRMMDSYVEKVKNLPEVEAGYMTLGDWIDSIVDSVKEDMAAEIANEVTKEITNKVKEEDIKVVVEILKELHETKDNAVLKIRSKFPEFANQAEGLVEKYWKEG